MGKWIDFYQPFFVTRDDSYRFVEACENDNTAKIMMHQCERLISISDHIPQIEPHSEALQLLFLMTCAEHIAKLHDNYHGEKDAKKYVKRFFRHFLSCSDRGALEVGFVDYCQPLMRPLGADCAVDMLWKVRCDVVHEGKYWHFTFHDGITSMLNNEPNVISHITFKHFRGMVVRGCITAIQDRLRAAVA